MGTGGDSRADARRRYALVALVLAGVLAGSALAAITLFEHDLDPVDGGSIHTDGKILLVESTSIVQSGGTVEALDVQARHNSDHRVACVVSSRLITSTGKTLTSSGDEPFYVPPDRSERIRLQYGTSVGTSEYMVYEMNASDCRMLGWPMAGVTASRNGSVSDVLPSIVGAPRLAINYSVTPTTAAIETAPTVAGEHILVGDRDGQVTALYGANGTTDWTLTTGGAVNGSIAVDGETAYVGSANGSVRAVWLANGTVRWSNTSIAPVEASPAVADGRVIVPTDAGLRALNASDGSTLWAHDTAAAVRSAPGERDGVVVVGTDDGTVLAVDATDGSVLWTRSTGARVRSPPALVNETAFVGSADGHLYAFAESDGATRYSADLGTAVSGPAIYNGTVVVGTAGGRVVGLPTTGSTPKWTYDAGAEITATPAIANGTVYAADHDGVVHALDPQTGALTATNTVGGSIPSGAAVLDGAVVVADRSGTVTRITAGERVWRMAGYDATNAGYATLQAPVTAASPNWTVNLGANVTAGVAKVNGSVFAGTVGGTIAALDGTDGSQRWSRSLSGAITGSPAVVDGRVYTTHGDALTALSESDGSTLWTATPGGSIPGAPTVADDRVFVGGDALTAYDTSGSSLWQADIGRIETAPAVADETVVAGTTGGSIWAGDLSGVERWSVRTGTTVATDPAIRKDTVYVGSDADEGPLDWERRLWTTADFDRGQYNATTADGANGTRAGQLSMTYPNGTAANDLIGYYRLDRNVSGSGGTVYDYSGGDTSGVTDNDTAPNAEGVLGTTAFNFDAEGARIRVPDSKALSLNGSVSVAFWIKTSGLDSTENSHNQTMFVDKGTYATEGFEFLDNGDYNSPAMIYFRVYDGSKNQAGVQRSAVNDGTWHHLVGTYDNSTDEVAIYLDGVKKDTATAGSYVESSLNLTIGASQGGGIDLTNGTMDEIKLYSRALSPAQVDRLYRYGGDGTFDGSYNRTYATGHTQAWQTLHANVSALPAGTTANATVTVLDSGGAVLGSQTVTLAAGATTADLSVPDGPTARVTITLSADTPVPSPRIENVTLDHERVNASADTCTACRQAVYDTAAAWAQGESAGASAAGAGGLTAGRMRIGQPNGTQYDDLRAFYRFDRAVASGSSAGTVPDYSGNDNAGSIGGTVTTGANGTFGTSAYEFDGSEEYVAQSALAGDQLPMSVSMWYRWRNDSTDFDDLIGARDAAGNMTEVRIDTSSGEPRLTFQTNSSETGANGLGDVGSVQPGAWSHVGVTIEANGSLADYRLYHNGTLIAETTEPYSPGTVDLYVGGMNATGTVVREFNGSLDEVRLYDQALTAAEMATLATQNDTHFLGNYTERVTTRHVQRWESIEVTNATLPAGTAATVTVTAETPNGTALGSQTFDLSAGSPSYALDLPTSRDLEIAIEGSSTDPTVSWTIDDLTVRRDRVSSIPQQAVLDSGRQFDRGRYAGTSVDSASGPRGNLTMRYANGTASDALAAYYRLDGGQTSPTTARIDSRAEWTAGSFNASSADAATGTLAGNHSLTYANGSSGDGLLGYWRLDRSVSGTGGTVRDYSGEGQDGTTNNGTTPGQTGVFGTSAMGLTDSNITVPKNGTLEPTSGLTISTWIKRSGTQVDYAKPIWYGNATTAPYGPWGLQMDQSSDTNLQFKVTLDGTDTYLSSVSLPDGQWTHVTATYNGSTMALYRNGSLVASKSASGSISGYGDTYGLGIGDAADGTSDFHGTIDDTQLYDYGMSSAEVRELYRHGGDGTFNGNYSQTINSSAAGDWETLTIDAPSVPAATTPAVTLQAVENGTVQAERTVTPGAGTTSYGLSLPDTNSTRVLINGTSTDVTRSWRIDSVRLEDTGTTITETIDASADFDSGAYNATTSDAATGASAGNLSLTYANGTASDALAGYWRFDRSIGSGDTSANRTIGTLPEWDNGSYDGTTADAGTRAGAGKLRIGSPNGTAGDALPYYYRFDRSPYGNAGTVLNYSGSGGTATTRNGVTVGATGVFENQSFRFDGNDDYVNLGQIDYTGSMTISAWVNLDTTGSQGDIVGEGRTHYSLQVNASGYWQFETHDGSYHETGAPATTDAWVHLVGRLNTTTNTLSLWVNGTQVDTTSGGITDAGLPAYIGRDPEQSAYTFDGRIDEVRMYNTSLSDDAVRALYRAGQDGTFEGNYTRTYANQDPAAFNELTLDVPTLPSATGVDVTVEAIDSGGSVVDSTTVSPTTTGISNYSINLASATDTRVVVNATTTNVTRSPVIDRISLTGSSTSSATVRDYSGEDNDATANGTTSGATGVFETAAHRYDGSDDGVRVGRPSELNITGDLTLSAWASASVADGSIHTVVAKGDQWGLRVNANDRWEVFATDSSGTTHTVESATIATDRWVHLVGRYDASANDLALWVNGTQVGTTTASIASTDAAVTIGNSSTATGHTFDGRIDEVRISSTAVDAATVDRLYRHGGNGTFEGTFNRTYTADGANWTTLDLDVATLPAASSLSVTVETLSGGSVVDSRTVSPSSTGTHTYDLAMEDTADTRVTVTTNTTDPTRSARLDSLSLSGPESTLTVRDFGGAGLTGTRRGDPVAVEGVFGSTASDFDGTDDYIEVPYDPALDITSSFTLNAWVNPDTLDSTNNPIVSKDNHQWGLQIDDKNHWKVFVYNGSGWVSVAGPTPTADTWTHVVGRYNATSDALSLWINGTKVGTATATEINSTDTPLMIGSNPRTTGRYFDGTIDEVQIYDRPLSATEIRERYRSGTSGDFQGNYTYRVDTDDPQTWSQMTVETASLPAGATLNATVEARNASDTILDSTTIQLSAGTTTQSLDLPSTEDLVVTINGTTPAATDTFGVTNVTVEYDRASGPTVSDGEILALDRTDGTARWVLDTGSSVTTSPAVDRSTVYAGLANGSMLAINRTDGSLRWTYDGATLHSNPAVVNDTVYLGDGNRLVALESASGTERWSYTATGPVRAGPVPISETVYVGANDTDVVALR